MSSNRYIFYICYFIFKRCDCASGINANFFSYHDALTAASLENRVAFA